MRGFKMENSSGLLNSLTTTQALMVLASTTESTNSTSTLCQSFAMPVTMDKAQVPFLGPSYTLAPVYHQADGASVEYPAPLLHLHPQFGVLGYTPLPSFPPFQEVERFRPAYLGSKSLKHLPNVEPPQIRYLASERDFKKYRAQVANSSSTAGKQNPAGPLGMTSSSETPWKSSQQSRSKNVKTVHDACVFLRCPLCQEELKQGDVQKHLQQELERLSALNPSCPEEFPDESAALQPEPSPSVKEEVETPSGSPLSNDERQQTFQQVKINRESRLNGYSRVLPLRTICNPNSLQVGDAVTDQDAYRARAKRCKRTRASDEEQVASLFSKDPRFPDAEEDSFPGRQYVEYVFRSVGRNTTPPLLGLKGSNSCTALGLTGRDSDGDLEPSVDEPPVFPKFNRCPRAESLEGHSQRLMEALDKDAAVLRTANLDEEEGVTSEILKARINELTQRLQRREAYRCHVCMGSYSVPLTSIQCWHIHCEECWLRTLGSKKLCPQCNTITSPGDLRRIYL
ncbi:E3 ubiquitin-protein ligase Rnf220-like isoform X1 [Hypanus sabinus]|uniref:E3 ubiquitin-protein ligase Rnf220-like isoform X1 n=2 Tax=Hypanus sabinus TaxID=79690 RepID=UPI0028C3A2DF|nr:E3 ubiquitin-protein ligase Rnf220-like isoform X1 [Hypanus sabinus]